MKFKNNFKPAAPELETFAPFMRLPLELRRIVYAAYFEDSEDVFSIENGRKESVLLQRDVPSLSRAFKEARTEWLHLEKVSTDRRLRINVRSPDLYLNGDVRQFKILTDMASVSRCTVHIATDKAISHAWGWSSLDALGPSALILGLPKMHVLDTMVGKGYWVGTSYSISISSALRAWLEASAGKKYRLQDAQEINLWFGQDLRRLR